MSVITKLYGGELEIVYNPDDKYHRYVVNSPKNGLINHKSVSVTTATGIVDKSNQLMSWAVDLFKSFLEEELKNNKIINLQSIIAGAGLYTIRKTDAGNIGTLAHKWISEYIKHKINGDLLPVIPTDQKVQIAVNAFLTWENKHKLKYHFTEKTVYSLNHDYIGTMDIGAMVDGFFCEIDLKTGSGIYDETRAQTVAYLKADEEESGKHYEGRWALRLAKETEEEYIAGKIKKKKKTFPKYQVFEPIFYDNNTIEKDFEAFLGMLKVVKWKKELKEIATAEFLLNKKI